MYNNGVTVESHKGLERVTPTSLLCTMLVNIHFRKYCIRDENQPAKLH